MSEAWHSFSDIATSVLVLFVLWRSASLARRPQSACAGTEPVDGSARPRGFRRFMGQFFGERIESTSSILIGIFLTFIAISLIINAWSTKIVLIQRPLLTGILFLILSAGSYFLFRFLSMWVAPKTPRR